MRFLFTSLAFAAATLGTTTTTQYSVFETLPSLPPGWHELPDAVTPSSPLTLRMHLAQQNVAAFEQQVLDISTPSHPSYGEHMSHAEIKRMLSPSRATQVRVLAWLDDAGVREVHVAHDWVSANVTVAQAERLLRARYRYFADDGQKKEAGKGARRKKVLRTREYSLPTDLHEHVLLVQPTTMFGMRPMRSSIRKIDRALFKPQRFAKSGPGSVVNVTACNSTITPSCLKALYNVDYVPAAPRGTNRLGVTGFLEQYAQHSDLQLFLKKYAPAAAKGGNFTTRLVNGGLNTQNATADPNSFAEANLDIQYTVALSYPTENVYFSTAGRPPFVPDLDVTNSDSEPYLDWLNWVLAQKEIPQTITTSYGENEQSVPLSYRRSVCNLFAQLGARGVSVLFASGDSGPGWSCLSNDGKNTTKFLPTFPAGCPWVTAVGGTHHVSPEQAVSFSSGGFSETWPMPRYQARAVGNYFARNQKSWLPWKQYFNPAGRGIPDVAMQGENYEVVLAGQSYLIGGTSASAPAFAALVALLNDERVVGGRKPLGFLNPWLYSEEVARTFTDVTVGRSHGCNGTRWGDRIEGAAVIEGAGWDAVPGWDPVTGLGTPDFEKLRGF